MNNAMRLTLLGAILIGAGILVILRQILTTPPSTNPQLWGLSRWVAGAEFPGVPMICLGALLLFATIFMHR